MTTDSSKRVQVKMVCPPLADDAHAFRDDNKALHRRMRTERDMLWTLLAHLDAAGFKVTGAHDGEERHKVSTPAAALEVVFSVDESHVYVKREGDPKGHTLFIVLGNDGYDAVADYSIGPGFDQAMESFDFDAWDQRH